MPVLNEKVVSLLKRKEFSELTEIQLKAIPKILVGKDVLVISPTGTGKSEAAFLPILSKLMDLKEKNEVQGIKVLYVSPLKALNRDQLSRLQEWCKELSISLEVRHGDTTQTQRRKQVENPPEFMITTPETLHSMLVNERLREAMREVEFVVVDELHELLDSKRGAQLSLGLERLKLLAKKKFQLIGLSATIGNKEQAASFLSENCEIAEYGVQRELELKVEMPSKAKKADLKLKVPLQITSETIARLERIEELVHSHNRSLIFVNTRYMAESLSSMLFQFEELSEKLAVHHSSLGKEMRVETEKEFKLEDSKIKAVICTSSLELGIDIGKIDLVMQYHSPHQVKRLLQRIGRSGHRKHLVPKGVLIASQSAVDAAECAVIAKRGKQGLVERSKISENSLDVLGHCIVGMALEEKEGISAKKIFLTVKKALPYRNLTPLDFSRVIHQLRSQRLIATEGSDFEKLLIKTNKRSLLYYYENVSTIADKRKIIVKDAVTRKIVATLDEDFVASSLSEGVVFISRGRAWKALAIHDDEIVVEGVERIAGAIPDWTGEDLPVSKEAAMQVAELMHEAVSTSGEKVLEEKYFCSKEAASSIINFSNKQKEFFLPSASKMIIETRGTFCAIHSPHGTKVNQTISRAFASLLSSAVGHSVRVYSSPYVMLFEFAKEPQAGWILQVFKDFCKADFKRMLEASVENGSIARFKFIDVAKRFGFLRKDAELDSIGVKRLMLSQASSPIMQEVMNELLNYYFDTETSLQVIEEVKNGTIALEAYSFQRPSPILKDFMEFEGFGELLIPQEPTEQLLEAFSESLRQKRVEALCSFCLKSFSFTLGEKEDELKCPYCSSPEITLKKYFEVLKKHKAGKELKPLEKKEFKEAMFVSSLTNSYGLKAFYALETYGVGGKNASRVLSRMRKNEEEFFRDLLEAQKTFVRTRKYWKL